MYLFMSNIYFFKIYFARVNFWGINLDISGFYITLYM